MSIFESIKTKNYLKNMKKEVKKILESDIIDLNVIDINKLDKLIKYLRNLDPYINTLTFRERIYLNWVMYYLKDNIKKNNVDEFKKDLVNFIGFLEHTNRFTKNEKGLIATTFSLLLISISTIIILPIILHKKNPAKKSHHKKIL